jgi:hypothetical protein
MDKVQEKKIMSVSHIPLPEPYRVELASLLSLSPEEVARSDVMYRHVG